MNFLDALLRAENMGFLPVIPDIKCFSPKEGDLLSGRDPVLISEKLTEAGAPVLSVVTEEKEFHGSMDLLRAICSSVKVPVLRKDFIENADDLKATKEAGAQAILLMYSCLGRMKLEKLYEKALDEGLLPLVETHSREELLWAGELQAEFVGINNRDILKLERDDGDVSFAEGILDAAPKGAFVIAESGLRNGRDVRSAIRAGARGALVGTALLQAEDTVMALHSMMRPFDLKICGLMDRDGVETCTRNHADILGFVTEYPVDVPWNLDIRTAGELIESVRGRAETCLVMGGEKEKIVSAAASLRPDWIQLHYRETAQESEAIAEELHKMGIRVIRSIPESPVRRKEMFGTETLNGIFENEHLGKIDAWLTDSRDSDNAAKGGGSILSGNDEDYQAVQNRREKILFAGGGITADNIRDVWKTMRPDVVDVMTGVETSPGKKSEEMMRDLAEGFFRS